MRVRIVSYEDINAWILGKFARRLHEELIRMGVNADISSQPDPEADINHHIIYLGYKEKLATSADTLMITHIDDMQKLQLLERQLKTAKAGICMSASVMHELAGAGLPAEKLCYINPAHDGIMQPKKLVIGITSKVQPSGCKREYIVEQLFDHISPDIFSFSLMGEGWDKIVAGIRQKGFTVNYYNQFDYEKYRELVPTFDYYLYTGQDEGSMGFIDALAAGVKTIVTPQGYHLDAPNGIWRTFNETEELVAIFREIGQEKRTLIDAVASWTWKDYAAKHMEVWQHILQPGQAQTGSYADGLNSLLNGKEKMDGAALKQYHKQLVKGSIRKNYRKLKKIGDLPFVFKKIRQLFGAER